MHKTVAWEEEKEKKKKKKRKRKGNKEVVWERKEKKNLGDVFWFFSGLRGSSRGRRVFLLGTKRHRFFFFKLIFSFKEGILVTLLPKTISF
jgi:hypothetical protein